MPDSKISALTSASTPLGGTEVLPIVQSGTTKKVAVSDLTTGRTVSTGSLTVTGALNVTRTTGTLGTFTQTSATGYGLTLIPGADTLYAALIINNAANTLNQIQFYGNGTGQFAGTVGVGNATPSASGAGITFPATQSASTDVNTLDDYEEGTFSPTAIGASTAGTTTYTNQTGKYTKIGNLVCVRIVISWTAMTGTGVLRIGNLPFTSSGDTVGTLMIDGLNWSGGSMLTPYLPNAVTYMNLYGSADDAAWVIQQCVNEDTAIYISIFYYT